MKFLPQTVVLAIAVLSSTGNAFQNVAQHQQSSSTTRLFQSTRTTTENTKTNVEAKQRLLQLLGDQTKTDTVLADPMTKDPIEITAQTGALLGGMESKRRSIPYKIVAPGSGNQFEGSSDTYLNLLEPITTEEEPTTNNLQSTILKQALPYVPLPLRGPFSALAGQGDEDYVPMRDLFTSPAVSYAYERGWRQGFQSAGFPGPDKEAELAMEYFDPVVSSASDNSVVVDMSCATGLFTRRFAMADKYDRVLGCDYSESMLTEARRRINGETKLNSLQTTTLDLVRLDVGQIPMLDASVDCLHAGAAMHCWPDLDAAVSEIYRVLKPGGRYFATTFLVQYFSALQNLDGNASVAPSQQAFQYFESVDTLRDLLERGGFESDKITIEVLGTACVVIRAEK